VFQDRAPTPNTGFLDKLAAMDDERLPPDPGTAPIPEGHVRLYHYTPLANAPSIRGKGLLREYARSDLGNGDLTQPSAGVWASTNFPKDVLHSDGHAAVVEFHAHPDEISGNAESPWHALVKGGGYDQGKLREWNSGHHHVIMRGSVPPESIIAVHEPWHHAARYMRDSGGPLSQYDWVKEDYERGGNDHLEPYVRGLRALENGHRREAAAQTDPHHGEGPWYHGTPEELPPGARLQPGDAVGKRNMGSGSDSSRLWVSNDPWRASSYGLHVYEVDPHDRPRAPHAGSDEHAVSGATVLREVPYQEATRLSRSYQEGAQAYARANGLKYEGAAQSDPSGDYKEIRSEGMLEAIAVDVPEGNDIYMTPHGKSPVAEHAERVIEEAHAAGRKFREGPHPLLAAPEDVVHEHAPYHVVRDPAEERGDSAHVRERNATYHVVDRAGRSVHPFGLAHSGRSSMFSGYSGAMDDWYRLTHRAEPQDIRYGKNGQQRLPQNVDSVEMHKMYAEHLKAHPPEFEHTRVSPYDLEIAARPEPRVHEPRGTSPHEEYHGSYEVVRHPQTSRFHVIDNAGRNAGDSRGFDNQPQAERSRDYIDHSRRVHELGKGFAESLFSKIEDIRDPGGTTESRQSDKVLRDAQDLMTRHEGGRGTVKFDSDEDGGAPYYELEHRHQDGQPSGWSARHYGGPWLGIYHKATGNQELTGVSLPVDNREGKLLPGYRHQDVENDLNEWHDEEGGERENYETEDPRYDRDARKIQRWKQRHAGAKQQFEVVAHFDDGEERPFGYYTLRHRTEDLGERKPRHFIEAYTPDGAVAGRMNWFGTTGWVHHIDVAGEEDDAVSGTSSIGDGRDHQGRGLATAMWDWSQEMRPRAKHSRDQTEQGKKWARGLKDRERRGAPEGPPGAAATPVVAHFDDPEPPPFAREAAAGDDGEMLHPRTDEALRAHLEEHHRLLPEELDEGGHWDLHHDEHSGGWEDPDHRHEQFYHGTSLGFPDDEEPPERVVPQRENRFYPGMHTGEHAYATTSPDSAWAYAERAWNWRHSDQPRVLRVRPTGPFEKDPEESGHGVRSVHPWEVTGEEEIPEDFRMHDDFHDKWAGYQREAGVTAKRWYHGTRYEFQPGDVLEGGLVNMNQGYGGVPGDHVYYSGRPKIAAEFAHAASGPEENDWEGRQRVYQVEPDDTHERDPDEEEHADAWRARSARVVREVPWQLHWGRQDDVESAPGVKAPMSVTAADDGRRQHADMAQSMLAYDKDLSDDDRSFIQSAIDHIRRGAPASEPIDADDAERMARGMRTRDRMEQAGWTLGPGQDKIRYGRGFTVNVGEHHRATLSPNMPSGWHVRTHPADYGSAAGHLHHDLDVRDEDLPSELRRYYGSPQIRGELAAQQAEMIAEGRHEAALEPSGEDAMQGKTAALPEVVAHFGPPGHFDFYHGEGSEDGRPRTTELEEHLYGNGHGRPSWDTTMDEAIPRAQRAAYAGPGTNAQRRARYHDALEGLHQHEHDEAASRAQEAVRGGADPFYPHARRAELERGHHQQWEDERGEHERHQEAVREHLEDGQAHMHGRDVPFDEMHAHLQNEHGIPSHGLPPHRLPENDYHDPYQRSLEDLHEQDHGDMGSSTHEDGADANSYADMHGQDVDRFGAEHHLVNHHGFDLDELRHEEPSMEELAQRHAENHASDHRWLGHPAHARMDEEGMLPEDHSYAIERDDEEPEDHGDLPEGSWRRPRSIETTPEAPSEHVPDIDTAFSWQHHPYMAPPRSGADLWRHLAEHHGVTQSADSTKQPGERFMIGLHDKFHAGEMPDRGSSPHQHDVPEGGHDPVFGARQARALVAHFEDPAPRAIALVPVHDSVTAGAGPLSAAVEAATALGAWVPETPAEAVAAAHGIPDVIAALSAGVARLSMALEDMPLHPEVRDAVTGLAMAAARAARDAEELVQGLPPEASCEESGPPNR
jgi:hypothetical protein